MKFIWILTIGFTTSVANSSVLYAGDQLRLKAAKNANKPFDSKDDKINCDFPELTDIRDIARAFSLWTGKTYKVDEKVKKKARLISPEPVSKSEGLRRFSDMLSRNNLKVVESEGVFKIEVNEALDR